MCVQLDLFLGLKLNEYLPPATYLPYRLEVGQRQSS